MNAFISATLAGLAVATLMTTLEDDKQNKKDEPMTLGNFALGLDVKDIKASKAFYEKLDFKQTRGNIDQKWVVLMNGTTTIALFEGMFESNILTFNPGWDWKKEPLKDFTDVRDIQRTVKARGIQLLTEADEKTDGPASFTLVDPDGNQILVDQPVPRPKH